MRSWVAPSGIPEGNLSISEIADIETALRRRTLQLEALNRVAKAIASDLDLSRIVQTVTDTATELCGASFGAFFYNVKDQTGERYTLYALSGAPKEAFERFGLPRNTEIFDPTFKGSGNVRSDDIRLDPRYGKNAPHYGMPKGHLPVVSYLAIPVISRTGDVHGGLFFGHHEPGLFTDESEEMVSAIALHAAIALDNAQTHQLSKDEVTHLKVAAETAQRLAAIIESSDDAILSKDLNGIIATWNKGAEKLFGYTSQEAIGKPVTMLIPEDRQVEEPAILARLRRGESIDHYETVRRRRDGTLIDISLSVSPIKNAAGVVIGASKIARDITDRLKAGAQQQLLLREMEHRIKNLFALAGSVVSLSVPAAKSPKELASIVRDRLAALARAQSLTLTKVVEGEAQGDSATLKAVIQTIMAPYIAAGMDARADIDCPNIPVTQAAVTSLALLIHEFATNAAKYGALSTPEGHVDIACRIEGDNCLIAWKEVGGPPIASMAKAEGFGSSLSEATVRRLGGSIKRDWRREGLDIVLTIPKDRL